MPEELDIMRHQQASERGGRYHSLKLIWWQGTKSATTYSLTMQPSPSSDHRASLIAVTSVRDSECFLMRQSRSLSSPLPSSVLSCLQTFARHYSVQ